MKSSTILRRAAKAIEDRDAFYGCVAIIKTVDSEFFQSHSTSDSEATAKQLAPDAMRYFSMFRLVKVDKSYGWFGKPFDEQADAHRILALCMAAAIAESEGD